MRPYKRVARDLGLHGAVQRRNRQRSRVRARVEHLFRAVKRQFGYLETLYQGLEKNAAQIHCWSDWPNLWSLDGVPSENGNSTITG